MQKLSDGRVIGFGPFELEMDSGTLRKHGVRLKLQGKPFQILEALLARPGEVVTRDELRDRLWPADTFVDFESGLNTAANRLRVALGDSAENPRYIETVARTGYRFIGAVTIGAVNMVPRPGTREPGLPADLPLKDAESAPALARRTPKWAGWAFAVISVASIGLLLFRVNSTGAALQPSFRQITFRQGTISNARFGPDGQTILYSARWDAGPARVFEANTVSPESRQLPFEDDTLAGVSRSAELALLRNDSDGWKFVLSRIPLNGGAPLTVASGVSGADWAPDGKDFAVFRNGARDSVVEYPAGKVLYRSTGSVSDLRVSPTGDWLAFAEHPLQGDDAGVVRLLDRTGTSRELSGNWASLGGLAWAPSGKEVCFTAARSGVRHSVFCVTPAGKLRQVATLPGTTMLYDISKEGRVLLGIDRSRMMVSAATGGEAEHDISWFDWSHVQAISGDGSHLLFDETGEGGGPNHSVYLRDTRTASNVRLGDGQAVALSPDLNFALSLDSRRPGTLNLLSLTGGAPRTLSGHGIEYSWARCFPDGQSLLVGGHAPGKPLRLFVQPVSGGAPVAMTPDIYLHNVTISPDGRYLAGSRDRRTVVVPATGGEPRELALPFPAAPIEWTADGAGLYVRDLRSRVAARIARVDISRSSAKPWKELAPADKVGLSYVMNVAMTPDGKSWAYSYLRELSELYVVDGWS